VDLAGLSLPVLLVNLPKPFLKESSEISLNNNSLTVLDLMEPKDVTEVGCMMLWITSHQLESVPNPLIHTPLKMEHAKPLLAPKTPSPSQDTLWSRLIPPLPLNPLVTNNQSPLPLMPKTGAHTEAVFSPTVEILLTTVSYLLDIPQAIG